MECRFFTQSEDEGNVDILDVVNTVVLTFWGTTLLVLMYLFLDHVNPNGKCFVPSFICWPKMLQLQSLFKQTLINNRFGLPSPP